MNQKTNNINYSEEMPLLLRAAYLAMHRFTNALFAELGVTADQWVLVAVLEEGGVHTQQELVRRTNSDPNTIRAMLEILENRGLIRRKQHPCDGRARAVELSVKGVKACKRLRAASEPVRAGILAAFKPSEVPMLHEFLGRITEALESRRHKKAKLRA